MKKLIGIFSIILAMLSVSSCTVRKVQSSVSSDTVSVYENVSETVSESGITDVIAGTEPGTTVTTETTETVTTFVPDEPGDDVFAPIETLLQSPPVQDAFTAFCYYDITTGISYVYNGSQIVYGASLMKLPFAMSILYDAETEDLGLDEVFTFTGKENVDGTGEIKNLPVGSTYTRLELIQYLLKYSDNVALRELRSKLGYDRYFEYVTEIGADSFTGGYGWNLCAEDCIDVLLSAWEYISGDHLYSEEIKKAMVESVYPYMLTPGLGGKQIARKYGWDEKAYHDMGIVLDEHPYILVFLSDMDSEETATATNAYICRIAQTVSSIHEQIWGAHNGTETENTVAE